MITAYQIYFAIVITIIMMSCFELLTYLVEKLETRRKRKCLK